MSDEKLLLLKRHTDKSYPHHWGIPTGKTNPGEDNRAAVVRELLEETSILISIDNISLVDDAYIVNADMSFRYTTYHAVFVNRPRVTINAVEHVDFGWFAFSDLTRLLLVPDLIDCIARARHLLFPQGYQYSLFEGFPIPLKRPFRAIEADVATEIPAHLDPPRSRKRWKLVFGPPGAGKTAALTSLCRNNSRLVYHQNDDLTRYNSRLSRYLQRLFVDHDMSFFLPFQVDALASRHWQAFQAPDGAIVEQCIFTILAYSRALYSLSWLSDDEYATFYKCYRTYLSVLRPPTVCVHVTASVAALHARIRSRGREYETGSYTMEYVNTLRRTFLESEEDVVSIAPLTRIDTTNLTKRQAMKTIGEASY